MDVTKSAPKTKPHSSRVVVVWKGGAMKRTRQKPARRLVFVAEAPCAPIWWTIQDSNLKKNVLGSPCFCQMAAFAMDSWGCHCYPVLSKITPSYAFKGKNKGKCLAAQMHKTAAFLTAIFGEYTREVNRPVCTKRIIRMLKSMRSISDISVVVFWWPLAYGEVLKK